jgi:putative endonuclease
MYYTYILKSRKDNKLYIGYTKDLRSRFKLHNSGKIDSTSKRYPLDLIYYESCLNQQNATHREKYLKTYRGKQFLKNRLKSYFTG